MSLPVIWKEWVKNPQTERPQLKSYEGCYGELLEKTMKLFYHNFKSMFELNEFNQQHLKWISLDLEYSK